MHEMIVIIVKNFHSSESAIFNSPYTRKWGGIWADIRFPPRSARDHGSSGGWSDPLCTGFPEKM